MKFKLILASLLFAQVAFSQIELPQQSTKAEIEQTIGYTKIEVEYSRPNLNNRKAIGATLAPYGKVWRTGANENTVIEVGTDLKVEGKSLGSGKYSLYTIPNEKSWDVIFYKTTDNWGEPREWNEGNVALKVNVPVVKTNDKIESFSIGFENVTVDKGQMVLAWENTKVAVNLEAPTHNIAQEKIAKELTDKSTAREFYLAANYLFSNNIDHKKALEFANKAVAKDANVPYFKDLKTRIENALK